MRVPMLGVVTVVVALTSCGSADDGATTSPTAGVATTTSTGSASTTTSVLPTIVAPTPVTVAPTTTLGPAPTVAPTTTASPPTIARIAFVSTRHGDREIYVINADGTGVTRLTTHSNRDIEPARSHDGAQIVFASERDGSGDIYMMNSDGSGVVRLTDDAAVDEQPAVIERTVVEVRHTRFGQSLFRAERN